MGHPAGAVGNLATTLMGESTSTKIIRGSGGRSAPHHWPKRIVCLHGHLEGCVASSGKFWMFHKKKKFNHDRPSGTEIISPHTHVYIYILNKTSYIYIYIYIPYTQITHTHTHIYIYHMYIICIYIYIIYIYIVSARIIERSQEDKSTVKYRTFVLLRVPIRSGVGKFNYRTGRRTKVRYFTVLLSSWLRSIISGTDMIFTAYLYIYNL